MKRTLSVMEIKVLLLRAIEEGEVTIQQSAKEIPSFAFNLKVSKCILLHNGVQFYVNGGYINFEFHDNWEVPNGLIEEQAFDLEFSYDRDKPKGYWLRLGDATFFFHGNRIVSLLENLQEEIRIYEEKHEKEVEFRREADKDIPGEVWASIENMMEK